MYLPVSVAPKDMRPFISVAQMNTAQPVKQELFKRESLLVSFVTTTMPFIATSISGLISASTTLDAQALQSRLRLSSIYSTK